jgi:hypothetical protein
MNKNDYLTQIISNAEAYQARLMDKAHLFLYQSEQEFCGIEVNFTKANFKHLIGIETHLKANDFFDNCINHTLSSNLYRPSTNTPVKLLVFNTLLSLPEISATIGEYNGTNLHLQVDIIVAKQKMVLGLARNSSKFYFPKTLIREGDFYKYMKSQHPVLVTFTKSIGSGTSKYVPTYIHKKCDITELFSKLPKQFLDAYQLTDYKSL